MIKRLERLDRSTNLQGLTRARKKGNANFPTIIKYKKFPLESNELFPNSLDYFLYHEICLKFKELYDVVKFLHFARITDGKLSEELEEYCFYALNEFIDQWNLDFSQILGTRIKLLIPSHKWSNSLYSNKSNILLPTMTGFEL
jgi:hypothetical protein